MKKVIILLLFFLLWLGGEVRCMYEMYSCNWNPIGKAEILYTIGAFTATGGFIGWIDIKDN